MGLIFAQNGNGIIITNNSDATVQIATTERVTFKNISGIISLQDETGTLLTFAPSDVTTINGVAASGTVNGVLSQLLGMLPGGTGNNIDTTLATLAAAGLGTTTTADFVNADGRGIVVVIDITTITGTSPTLTVTIQGKDVASGKYYTLLTSTALNAAATTVLTVYPGVTTSANIAASQVLPRSFRLSYTIGGTGPSVTATIGSCTIV